MSDADRPKTAVLMLITSFHPNPMGGSEAQAFRLAKELVSKGLCVHIAAIGKRDQPADEFVDGIRVFRMRSILYSRFFPSSNLGSPGGSIHTTYKKNDPANFVVAGKKSILSFLSYFRFLEQVYFLVLRKRAPVDVIYVPIMEWTAYVGVVLGKMIGKKVVIKDSTMNGITNLLRYPAGSLMQRMIIANGYFVAMTRAIRSNYHHAGIPEARIFDIPNGVTVPSVSTTREVDRNKFVFIGNLRQQPAKGVDVLIKAWRKVVERHSSVQLFLIGDGNIPEYEKFTETLGIRNSVKFLGKQSQLEGYLLECLAFILPSRREGMSNALLEAMSLGVACIATDISGNQDLIQDQVNGILIAVEDEDALAKAVSYLYEHPDRAFEMGVQARRTIENKYTLSRVSQQYQELFESLSPD